MNVVVQGLRHHLGPIIGVVGVTLSLIGLLELGVELFGS